MVPTSPPQAAQLNAAFALLKDRQWADARDRLLAILREDSSHAAAYTGLGLALIHLGQPEDAVSALERAHYLAPADPAILHQYGLALSAAGRPGEAQLRFEAALRLKEAVPGAELAGGTPRPADRHGLGAGLGAPVPPLHAPEDGMGGPGGRSEAQTAPPEPEDSPEPPPGFPHLCRAAAQLWLQRPLVWLSVLLVPNTLAALAAPGGGSRQWLASLLYTAALGIGAAPTILAAGNEWIYGSPLARGPLSLRQRLLSGSSLAFPYVVVVLGFLAAILARESRAGGALSLLIALGLTLPFHALAAPALAAASVEGTAGGAALRSALRGAGRRSWIYLGVMAVVGTVLGGGLVLAVWMLSLTLGTPGPGAERAYHVVALSLVESVWCVVVAVCGLDARALEAAAAVDDGLPADSS